jgi:hypothetical protein
MERKRLQHQKINEQQRFCVSQQDLTEALARMKPTVNIFRTRRRSTDENLFSSSSHETLNNRSVSQLIKEFEARANITPYASAQDLLPIVNDVISNGLESNCSHMSIRTMKIKGNSNDNDIINNNVCSPISRSINDDNQMVTEEIHQQKFIGDKRGEKNDEEEIHQTLDKDRHKQDLLPSPFSSSSNNNNNHRHHPTQMLTRSTDIDAAALTLGKRHEIRFDELLNKEAQLNHALADLLSISNDVDKSTSRNSSPKSRNNQRVSNGKNNNNISASIDLLNNLLDTFNQDDEYSDHKKPNQKNDDHHVKPINMFW